MSSTTEVGHARNVANFSVLVEKCSSLGTAYNPSRSDLKIESLRTSLETASRRVVDFHSAASANTLAVAAREKAFLDFGKRITRVHSALKASTSSDQVDEKADALIRALRGGRKSSGSAAEPKSEMAVPSVSGDSPAASPKRRSVSHASYDLKLDHLDRYLSLLTGVGDYAPNEPDLQLSALGQWRSEMGATNAAVVQSATVLEQSRATRDDALYASRTGLADLASDCKSYIKSIFGTTSPEYKAVSGIRVTRNG